MADNRYYGGITVGAAGFEIGAQAPVDSRFRVKNAEGLNELLTYEGLVSYNEADKKYYQFRDGAWRAISVNTAEELAAIISAQIATETTGAMEFKGAAATLPENPGKGDMYKVAGENINIVIDDKAAKAGDTIIYNDKWYLIPSGDDIEDTWRPVNIAGNELGGEEALKVVAGENVTITKKDDGSFEIASQYEDTHYESKLVVGNETADVNDENVENGNVHLNLVEDGTVKSSHKIVGAGGITVTHTKAADEEGVNVITIEAPEGAKYDLAAKTENNEAVLSLAGTDNTEDKVVIVGDDAVTVTVNEAGKVVISAHDTTYEGSTGEEVTVTVTDGVISAALVEVGLEKLADAIQTKLGYIDTEKNISVAISDAIDGLLNGAINDITKDGDGIIDTRIGNAIDALKTVYVKEEGFNDRVAGIKVTNAGHADTATNAVNADNAEKASTAGHATTAGRADTAGYAEEAGYALRATEAEQAGHASTAGSAIRAEQAGKVESALTVKVGGADVVFDGSEAKTADVDAAIKAAVDAIPAVVHPEYSITKDAAPGAYGAVYHLTKDGAIIGEAINIPKDMVVQTGSVVVATEADKALDGNVVVGKTYIKLVIQNVTIPLYIAADQLIEYVTSGSAQGDMVVVNIDETTHKVTATITDGTVTEAKLHSDVTTKLNKVWDAEGAAEAVKKEIIGDDTQGGGDLTLWGLQYLIADTAESVLNDVADNYATKEQGEKADSALQSVEVGTGLKVTEKADNKQTISIDDDVIFVLNCNY